MLIFSIGFVLVLLSGSDAVFTGPRFPLGNCTYMEYHCDLTKCSSLFYKRLRERPKGDCSNTTYNKLVDCVVKTMQLCHYKDTLTEIQLKENVRQHQLTKKKLCSDGFLLISSLPYYSTCNSSFGSDVLACTKTFKDKVAAADFSDPSLCPEMAKAKKCLKKLLDSDCYFPSDKQELKKNIDAITLGDYNPFCTNQRDPGATGNDICYGVKVLNNTLNNFSNVPVKDAAAGLKSSVLQALLFLFLSLMLFVKG